MCGVQVYVLPSDSWVQCGFDMKCEAIGLCLINSRRWRHGKSFAWQLSLDSTGLPPNCASSRLRKWEVEMPFRRVPCHNWYLLLLFFFIYGEKTFILYLAYPSFFILCNLQFPWHLNPPEMPLWWERMGFLPNGNPRQVGDGQRPKNLVPWVTWRPKIPHRVV